MRKQLQNSSSESAWEDLARESQFQKAEIRRAKTQMKDELSVLAQSISNFEHEIQQLKQSRTHRSNMLQQWIFAQTKVFDAHGRQRDMLEIFKTNFPDFPPSGAGDCAMPKMLNYAYGNSLEPLCVGEYWWGESPKGLIRRKDEFYGACSGKCKPILGFMLQGLDVNQSRVESEIEKITSIKILYEDEHLIAVDKPSGLLSEPGLVSDSSVVSLIATLYPHRPKVLIVHRLDMATSGVLVLAFDELTQKELQRQFANREVKKEYVAVLNGLIAHDQGNIELPLRADLTNRPYQVVDFEDGKTSSTVYRVVSRENGKTRIKFFPLTGRTHQLRVHSAHKDGLNVPICGDSLYGSSGERLLLHARKLKFTHPITKRVITITSKVPF